MEGEPNELVIRGAVRGQKPPGLYTPEDVRPLTIHHMLVELRVRFPSMEIVGADVLFETHPHESCPPITDHYGELVGLSIARGFNNKVRELFGGATWLHGHDGAADGDGSCGDPVDLVDAGVTVRLRPHGQESPAS